MLSRLVRIFNVGAAALVVLVLAATYWYAFRPLPQVSGELAAPVSGPATIRRDVRGVPHIAASSWQDAMFLQGFATAQDRLWQMDTLRRFAAGELAEVFGAAALPADERSRRMRMRALAENNAAHLLPDVRAAIVEYARGVNFYINTHRRDLPLEFSIPGREYDPRPWTPVDSMLVGLIMYRDLTDSSKLDFDKGLLLSQAPADRVRALFPASQGYQASPGSNAWAVSGAHSASGKPLLANDPHLAFGIPGTWHQVHLQAPGLNVAGVALPGVPCVISGHNDQIAWGVTNMQTDVMDLYVEQIDERTGRYIYQGQPQQAVLERQAIGVRGAKPAEIDTWITRHGPVLLHASGKSYSLRWSASDGFGFPFLTINRAHTWDEFRGALKDFWGPGQNFVYADRAGNIGYQATGRMPIRGNGVALVPSDAPLDGATGTNEWTGYIPFEQMPSIYNPPSGIIATANQNPFPAAFPYAVPGTYADGYRVRQIRSLLESRPRWRAAEMLAIQKDVYSAYDRFLAAQVLAAIARCHASDLDDAASILQRWDGQMDKAQAAPVITQLLDRQLAKSLLKLVTAPANPSSDLLPRPEILQGLLRLRPLNVVPANDWDKWLLSNLRIALDQGRQRQGSPIARWQWGRMLEWKLAHPVGKEIPLVDRFFDIGPVPMSGSPTTVKQTTASLGPSERMVVDLGNLDDSVQNLPGGESGMVASPHYKDQWDAYYSGTSFPLQFHHIDAKHVLTIHPSVSGR